MKTLRIILIVLIVLYGLGTLTGAVLSLFNPAKQAELQHLGEMTPGLEKLLLFSGALLVGQVWLYFSTLALLVRNMKEGYMYAVTLGFIEFIQAIVIVIALGVHHFGSATDYFAILKGLLLLILALVAFKKSQISSTIENKNEHR
jgi:type IV secretory pathway VirB2 component (pilin)